MFQRNYLLDHIRQDGRNALLFCALFAAAGLYPWFGMAQTPENASLRFSGVSAVLISLVGLAIAAGPALNPKSHHTVQDLQRYGSIDQVLKELQEDFAQATQYSRLALGPVWLSARGVGITVVRRDEIAGVQLGETKLPNGMDSNWRLIVTTRDGRVLDFNCRNREIADIVLRSLSREGSPNQASG